MAPMPLEFVSRSLALSRDGLDTTARSLAVGAPEIWSLLAVETSCRGFLADRRPQILFERHIFHKLTGGRFDDGQISDPTPGGYGKGGAHQYDRLAQAIAKDRAAALQSASWGLGQILGVNFALAGFADVEAMVAAMSDSEDGQLAAVASFLQGSRLDAPLQAHDWTAFARGYNGKSFAKNQYDTRLRAEFQKFSAGAVPDVDIRAAQLYLMFLGFDPGKVDGLQGSRTRAALVDFQTQQGLDATGEVDDAVLESLIRLALV
ncbi:MAG TPA: N-acetylmuramidase domain-containing protein [Thermoanaerobaculia bacterium]|nr:N-acetylmuramidase domain-containing protein [Thermoanaerobaculia bacterium]